MVKTFQYVTQNEGGFWGVFVVLQFPGLGVDASGEERQGKVRRSVLEGNTCANVCFNR